MDKFDFIASFYNTHQTRDTLIKSVDSLIVSQNLTVYAIPFSIDLSPKELMSKESVRRRNSLKWDIDGVQLYQLKYHLAKTDEERTGHYFIYEHPEYKNIFVCITIEGGDFYRHALLPFLQGLRPRVMLTFISHKKLRRLLEIFQERYQIQKLTISRASYRIRFEEKEKAAHIIPGISWPNMDLEEAFKWVYQNNGWFQSIQFTIGDKPFSGAKISFNRQGIANTNTLFPKVFEAFTIPVCKTINDNIQFFGKRSRPENNFSARPLVINFDSDQFSDVSENKKFINAVKRLKASSVSVLHGNPYVHLSVMDYIDASTYDLWVLGFNKLFIVPQLKGTIPSIKRIINHIFDTYAEGEIKDYSEVVRGA